MKRKICLVLTLVVALSMIIACAHTKPWGEWTPDEKAYFFNTTYHKQYEQYKRDAAIPNLTREQALILQKKKETFKQVWPVLKLYSYQVNTGQIADPLLEQQLLSWMSMLQGMAIRAVQ